MNTIKIPVITLVGQRSSGKSTLFNRLTCTHNALVSNSPEGFTRDRRYGKVQYKKNKFIVIDTGSFELLSRTVIQNDINNQILCAVKESCITLFIVNGEYQELLSDLKSIRYLQKLQKNIFVVINKIDTINQYHQKNYNIYNYRSLGIEYIIPISAMRGYGITNLLEQIFTKVYKSICNDVKTEKCFLNVNIGNDKDSCKDFIKYSNSDKMFCMKLAIAGRPNSGKSTFVNYVSRSNRMITSSIPGTTRDSIYVPVNYGNYKYILIDTAGIRRKNKINNISERMSVGKSLNVFKTAHMTLFMIDINEGIVDQDLLLLRFIVNNSKSLILVVNKCDSKLMMDRKEIKKFLEKKISFLNFANIHFISALHGTGINFLFQSIQETYQSSLKILSTSRLMHILHEAVLQYPPPVIRHNTSIRIVPKLKYVHVGGYNPPVIVVHGTQVNKLPEEYRRYLRRYFYSALKFYGILLRIRFKDIGGSFVKKILN